MDNMDLKFVSEFKYLGHFITNDEHDDKDVLREVRAMFTHTNILARRFFSCSVSVKIVLVQNSSKTTKKFFIFDVSTSIRGLHQKKLVLGLLLPVLGAIS